MSEAAYQDAVRAHARAQSRKYYAAHREERRAYARAYYRTHRAERLAYKKAYHVANRAKEAARKKAWRETNLGRVLEHERAYEKKRIRPRGGGFLPGWRDARVMVSEYRGWENHPAAKAALEEVLRNLDHRIHSAEKNLERDGQSGKQGHGAAPTGGEP